MNGAEMISSIQAGIDRAIAVAAPKDDVLMILAGNSDPWISGANENQSVSLVVPSDDDFWADAINIYLSARRLDNTDKNGTGTDLTFRPAMWVTTDNTLDVFNYFVQDANATWKLSDTFNDSYQGETGLSIAAAYSARYGQGSVYNEVALSAWPGARKFFIPHKVKRGSTITVGITPTFGRLVNTAVVTQFRATVVLSGFKSIRRAA